MTKLSTLIYNFLYIGLMLVICFYVLSLRDKINILEIELNAVIQNNSVIEKEQDMVNKIDHTPMMKAYLKLVDAAGILQDAYDEASDAGEAFDASPLDLVEDAMDCLWYEFSDEELEYLNDLDTEKMENTDN